MTDIAVLIAKVIHFKLELQLANTQLCIEKTPEILSIHLKRFAYQGARTKVESKVHFPKELNMQKWTTKHDVYNLYGIIVHRGTSSAGHYVAYVFCEQWYEMNDSAVRIVSEEDALKENAYMLFYQRKISPLHKRRNSIFDEKEGKKPKVK
jgi:ubiquitin C-terminal hydrolase